MRFKKHLDFWTKLIVLTSIGIGSAAVFGANPRRNVIEPDFVSLFDGETMDGWKVIPENDKVEFKEDAFFVANRSIIARECEEHWLRYEKEQFENFVLRLQYNLFRNANSGICIRAQEKGAPWQTGFEVQLLADFGKSPSKHTTGAIYDVVTPMYNASKKAGQYNDLEITCIGKLVKVKVNGITVVDTDFSELTSPMGKFDKAYNDLPLKGYICLQDHGQPVAFRHIRIKKLPSGCQHSGSEGAGSATKPASCTSKPADESGFIPLFDGTSTKGWAVYPNNPEKAASAFVAKNGILHCPGGKGCYFRYEERPFDDFILRLEWRVPNIETNSGIMLRTTKEGAPQHTGFEVQIRDKNGPNRKSSGAIYDVATPMFDASRNPGQWNQAEITCNGPLVKVVLNGLTVINTDFRQLIYPIGKFKTPYAQLSRIGYVALQNHGHEIDFRNIRIKSLR